MAAQMMRSDVCIVGDGAVGKAAALGFSQAGLRVTLISALSAVSAISAIVAITAPKNIASPSFTPVTSVTPIPLAHVKQDSGSEKSVWDVRVYALNHVAQGLLSSLKVWDALDMSRISAVTAMKVFDADEQSNGSIAFDAYGAYENELAWIVEDKNLNQALDAALQFASNITRVTGQVTNLTYDDSEQNLAVLQLASGEKLISSLVIGADGAQSWVRNQCDIAWDYRSYHQQGVVTNFTCEKPHLGVAHQWFAGDKGIIALLPLPNNQVSLVWSAPDALAQELLSDSLSSLAARLSHYAQADLGELTPLQPENVKAFPLRFIAPQSMIAQRVALIGDAAHVIHPLAGHGMNLGFADVQSLLSCVSKREAHRDCGDARVLRRYQRARKEEVAIMQMTTDGLERLFASQLTPIKVVRNIGLNLLNQFPMVKRQLITQAMGKSKQN